MANTHTRRGVLVGLYINTWCQTSIDEVSLFFECWLHVCNDFFFPSFCFCFFSLIFLGSPCNRLCSGFFCFSVNQFQVSDSVKTCLSVRRTCPHIALFTITCAHKLILLLLNHSHVKKRSKDKSDNPKASSPSASAAPDKDSATDAS